MKSTIFWFMRTGWRLTTRPTGFSADFSKNECGHIGPAEPDSALKRHRGPWTYFKVNPLDSAFCRRNWFRDALDYPVFLKLIPMPAAILLPSSPKRAFARDFSKRNWL